MSTNLDHLRTLAAAVDAGTFDAAAVALHITPSAVSQRIKAMEEQSGRVLVRRSKPIEPTEAGAVLLRLARQLELLTTEADAVLAAGGEGGTASIPLVVNADSLATWVLPALATLEGVAFEIVLDDQEHTLDRLRDGTAMGAIGSDAEAVQGCTVAPLGAMVYRPVASPAYVERWCPDGWTPETAATAPVLVYDRKDALQDRYVAAFAPGAHPPRSFVPASTEFVRALELGLGWGMLPDLQGDALLADGRLVVLDDAGAQEVPLYWHQWSLRSATLEAVARAIRLEAARALGTQTGATAAVAGVAPTAAAQAPAKASTAPGRARPRTGRRSPA